MAAKAQVSATILGGITVCYFEIGENDSDETDEHRKYQDVHEKLVCFWSKKHYERELHENQKFTEYLNSVIANPDKLKDKQKKIEKFLVEIQVDKDTGEVMDTRKHLSIDSAKVKEYLDTLGYYTILTSEVDMPDRDIIRKYRGLSRIEDSFRITKSDLEGRPVFVSTPEHINAHFLTCFIALTMIRLLQYGILKSQGKDVRDLDGWESGLSAERIQSALGGWMADVLPGGYFRLTKPSRDLNLLLDLLNHKDISPVITVPQLRSLKRTVDKTIFV
jgi:hypothetical protein